MYAGVFLICHDDRGDLLLYNNKILLEKMKYLMAHLSTEESACITLFQTKNQNDVNTNDIPQTKSTDRNSPGNISKLIKTRHFNCEM